MIWGILRSKKMSKEFWAEATNYLICLSNHSLIKVNEIKYHNKIRKKDIISHLRIFGSITYTFML